MARSRMLCAACSVSKASHQCKLLYTNKAANDQALRQNRARGCLENKNRAWGDDSGHECLPVSAALSTHMPARSSCAAWEAKTAAFWSLQPATQACELPGQRDLSQGNRAENNGVPPLTSAHNHVGIHICTLMCIHYT